MDNSGFFPMGNKHPGGGGEPPASRSPPLSSLHFGSNVCWGGGAQPETQGVGVWVCFSNAGCIWSFSNSTPEELCVDDTQRKVTKCRLSRWQLWACLASPLCSPPAGCVLGLGREKTHQHREKWEGRNSETQGHQSMEPSVVAVCLLSG